MNIQEGFHVSQDERRRAARMLIVVTLCVLIGSFVVIHYPTKDNTFYPRCPWFMLTHTYCPGCGTLRAIEAAIHGNFRSMFHNNILACLLSPILIYCYGSLVSRSFWRVQLPMVVPSKSTLLAFSGIILIYWLLRNLIPVLSPLS